MASIATHARPTANFRWVIGVLLGVGILINYFDRVNLTVAGPALRNEFGIDDVQFGYLLSAFAWTYALLQIPIGVVLDRLGIISIGRIGTFLWSLASAITAISSGFVGIFASRLLLGIAETPAFPVSSKATGYWFPTSERGLATAIFDSAAKLSSAIGIPIVAYIAVTFGWRGTFWFVGTVGDIMNFVNNVMGILAPIATGYIVGATQSFANAYITAAVVLLIGIFSYVFVLGKIEPIPEPT
ncbi:MAG: MFS transporter [Vulcanimicrobiaceae bacterium]